MKIVETIRSLCKDRGVSVNSLEAACGIGKNTILKWDIHEPSVGKVKKVADFFDVTIEELIEMDEILDD